jgi:hypothetical protein
LICTRPPASHRGHREVKIATDYEDAKIAHQLSSLKLTERDLIRQLTRALEGIDGFLYLGEAWALHESVRNIPLGRYVTVAEIGSWKGRSAIALALGVKTRGEGRVFAIDPHTGTGELREAYGVVDTFVEFNMNLQAAGVAGLVEPLRALSHDARPLFRDKSVQVLFIDGSHEYGDVIQDIRDWLTVLSDEAVVAFNDPSWPGVYRALKERVVCAGNEFRKPRLVQNTLFFQFRRGVPWEIDDSIARFRLWIVLWLRYQANRVRPLMPVWLVQIGHRLSELMVGGRTHLGSSSTLPGESLRSRRT